MTTKPTKLFNISSFGVDTGLEFARPGVHHALNHVVRHIVPRLLDGLLQRLDRFVGFCACDRLDVAPNCIVQRVQIRAVRRPLLDCDETRHIFSKPLLGLLGFVTWGRVLLVHSLNFVLSGVLVPPERLFCPGE